MVNDKELKEIKKVAVVLFNLGGPDNLAAVKPFLFNLFYDRAIINLPNPFRFFLAKFISSKREKEAAKIYSLIGGKSPILEETEQQRLALEKQLNLQNDSKKYKVFIAMRYYKPYIADTHKQVLDFFPDEVVLLPLYPHFSTTTTGSSFVEWDKLCGKESRFTTRKICCYYDNDLFIDAHVKKIEESYAKITDKKNIRILFSAHGLPQKIVDSGDPYQFQIKESCRLIVDQLGKKTDLNLDWQVCYQSKVGPLKWLTPSTKDELIRAGKERKSVIIVPISFVSEHSETLVELDIEYKHFAHENGIKDYFRVETLSLAENYIACLKDLSAVDIAVDKNVDKFVGRSIIKICPADFSQCPCRKK